MGLYFLVPSFISSFWLLGYYSTSWTITAFYKSFIFISAHEGLFAGVSDRHLKIKSYIPGENLSLARIGFLVESKIGTYLTKIL